jgi:hypothetical protein
MFMLCSIARAKRQPGRFDLWTGVSEASLSTSQPRTSSQKGEAVKLRPWSLVMMVNWLSGFFHREFGFLVGGVWFGFAACENFKFAERAKDKLNHITRAAFIVVVRAWTNATD